MEYQITEFDIKALRREILRKCGKKLESLLFRGEEEDYEDQKQDMQEDIQEEDIPSTKTDEIVEEELPFEDILAEKRRKYTAREEFIYLLYNNILPAFIVKWDGYFLRKKLPIKKLSKDDIIEEGKEVDNLDESNDLLIIKEEKKREDKMSALPWKLSLPDEFATIKFYNDNSYSGRISRKMMEGEGTYIWHNGVRYKGEFERNQIRGKGLLEWSNNCWYEGDFVDGLRHGKGIMVDKESNRSYVGQWHMGSMNDKESDI